ncbi:hypothetical protein ACP4OV_012803 [Aristida adscensionis]
MAASLLHLLLPPLLFLAAAAAAAADMAPGPSPPELNLTRVLEKGELYTTLLRLLRATGVADQLAAQLRSTYDGLTFFAPNDAAFAKLPGGALNGLGDQQRVQLLLYHVVPRYYSLATFQTASNPLRTEASGAGGVYGLNVTATTENRLVNVSTGVVDVPISATLLAEFPLAVYAVDDVLRPEQLLGEAAGDKAVSAPAPAPGKKRGGPNTDVAAGPMAAGAEDDDDASGDVVAAIGSVEWGRVVALALMVLVNLIGA